MTTPSAVALVAALGLALTLAGRGFAAPAAVDTWGFAAVALGFVLFSATRSVPSAVAAAAVAAHVAAEAWLPGAPLAFASRLTLEAAATALPLAAIVATAVAVRPDKRTFVWRGAVAVAALAALVGAGARAAAAWALRGRPGSADTIAFVLRFDVAAVCWGFAALAVTLAIASVAVARHRSGRRGTVALGVLVALVAVPFDGGAVVAAAGVHDDLAVGYHADHVADVPSGATWVHLEVAWPLVERTPGVYDWDVVQRELDDAAARGLNVCLLINTYPPEWFIDAHRASVMQDADGEPFTWLDEAPGAPRERVWDLSFADPAVVAAKRAFLAAATARFADLPAVAVVAVQNEPAYPTDWNLLRWAGFDAHTLAAFRVRLAETFAGDLDALNEAFDTSFGSWVDVRPPRWPFGDFGAAWLTFREDTLIAFVDDLVATAKAHTTKPVTVKIMAHFLTRFAEPQAGLSERVYAAFVAASDVVSVDLYPATRADLARSIRHFSALAGDKPLIVAEFQSAWGTALPGQAARTARALATLAPYADAVILFSASGNHFLYAAGAGSAPEAGVDVAAASLGDARWFSAAARVFSIDAAAFAAFPGAAWRAGAAFAQESR